MEKEHPFEREREMRTTLRKLQEGNALENRVWKYGVLIKLPRPMMFRRPGRGMHIEL